MKKRSEFPSALAYWMYRNDLSGEEVAEMAEVDRGVVSRAKNGKKIGSKSQAKLDAMMRRGVR